MRRETVWEFHTAQFRIALEIAPEDLPPEDSFEFQEDIDMVRDGAVEWFQAAVIVYRTVEAQGRVPRDIELGSDHLGCCAYRTVREFYESHRDRDPMNRNCSIMRAANGANVSICHYFPDMVRQAIADARNTLETLCAA